MTVAHADLPRATGLPEVGEVPGITLVPDRYGNGTNVIAVPADCGFRFSYGPGSFARHRAEADRLGLATRVLDRPDLAWDVDEPGDVVPVADAVPVTDMTPEDRGPGGRRAGLPVGDLLGWTRSRSTSRCPRCALAVGAHPDDIEFGSGATLAKWAARGAGSTILVLTDGSKGSWDPDADLEPLVAERMEECRAAAAVIDGGPHGRRAHGGRVRFLGRVDGDLENGVAERREVARIIREVRPDVLLGHDPWRRYRLHPDHRAAGFLTLDALVAARDHTSSPSWASSPIGRARSCCSRPTCPTTSNGRRDTSGTKWRRYSATAVNSSRPWASGGPRRRSTPTARRPPTSPPRCAGRWPITDRWPEGNRPKRSTSITDL